MAKTTIESVNRNIEAEIDKIRHHGHVMQNHIRSLTDLADHVERGGITGVPSYLVHSCKAWRAHRKKLEDKLQVQFKRTKGSLLRIPDHPEIDLAAAKHNTLVEIDLDRRDEALELIEEQILRLRHFEDLLEAEREVKSHPDTNYSDRWWETSE